MEKTIEIHPFQPHQTDGVIGLILPIQQIEFNVPVTLADQPDLLKIPLVYQQRNGQFWVAIFDGKVVGSIALIDCGEGIGCLRKMFVRADFRGKPHSLAIRLLDTLLQHSKERGFSSIWLGTLDRLHAAIRFYEKTGFEPVEKADLPAVFPIMPVDTHFFRLRIEDCI